MADNNTTIVEGSVTMKFPADEETAVFYNPVQVQNRDLSILMITLYAERRAIRKAVAAKRKELKAQKLSGDELKKQLDEYEKQLDGSRLVAEQNAAEEGLTILDALAASGLRSLRYWNEVPGVKNVTINDLELAAVERAHTNIKNNGLENVVVNDSQTEGDQSNGAYQRKQGIQVHHGDATHEMYLSRRPQGLHVTNDVQRRLKPRWDVIDLDPYGSAAPFLDAAIQAIENGGLLCVTCTDMAALGGSHPETCYGRYASMPIPNAKYLQEVALRILLYSLSVTASKYGRTIRPIVSVGMDFYIRVFLEVYDDKAGASKLSLKIGSLYQSTQCPSFHVVTHGRLGGKKGNVYQPERVPVAKCEETGADFKVGGPLWLGPLHDPGVAQAAVERVKPAEDEDSVVPKLKWIATRTRLHGLLTSVSEELTDVPLYYTLPAFSKTLHCQSPPIKKVQSAILNAGYRVSGYHKDPQAIKTDAPNRVLWDILRVWIKEQPLHKPPAEDSPAAKILSVEPTTSVDWSTPKALRAKDTTVSRFPQNPTRFWGPKPKASGLKRKVEDICDDC